ncbi:MAG: oligopeptide transporter, OPT family [Elusimicrobia bacterium]|nr:oligopeptide transporter, OPT family [Elusimicrobiota bacterium]
MSHEATQEAHSGPSHKKGPPAEHGPHKPYVAATSRIPEFTWSAVLLGAVLGIVFGASSLYLVLKVGMTVSASIPVAVLSVTLFRLFSRMTGMRRATILENNIVQTTGSAGESIAFGVGVTMPALLILGYEMELARVMVVASLGGLLGILMMIPLRRVFIVQQHRKLAYPEGTACADVLIVGEQGGSSATTLFTGFGLAVVYKVAMSALRLWKDVPERAITFFKGAAISGEVAPELLGVGYIIGTKISCVMVAGGVLASWVLIPAIKLFGDGLTAPLFPATTLIRDMDPMQIWKSYVLYIGAGAVAAGGIISLFQALPTIVSALKAGLADILGGKGAKGAPRARLRTEDDLPSSVVALGSLGLIVAIAAAPMLGLGFGVRGLLGAALIVLFGFLFVTVSSRLTGEIGSSSNPISGMTVATLLLTCLVFVLLGWVGKDARLTALSIAAVVCIAASNGGTTSQDLKTGFLVGATPRYQQLGLLVGSLTSALVIGWTLLILNDAGTVYVQRQYAGVKAPLHELSKMEHLRGPDAARDPGLYLAWNVGDGDVPGLAAGKYLVDERGDIRYHVDPGINGTETHRADGSVVQKYNAPKARLMSLIIDGILTQKLPWGLVLLGVAIALVLELCGVSSLPFAVGVYLPLATTTPIFVGGMVRWVVDTWTKKSAAEADMSPGVLLSSGYIAGGAIAGIVIALFSLSPSLVERLDFSALGAWTQSDLTSVLAFGGLTAFLALAGAEKILAEKKPRGA